VNKYGGVQVDSNI